MEEPVGNIYCNVTGETITVRDRRMAALCALFLSSQLRYAIKEQRYKTYWAPLSKPYLRFKKKRGWSINTWEATGYLQDQIRAYWSGSKNAFVVGINPYDRHPGGRSWTFMRNITLGGRRHSRKWLITTGDGWYTLKIAKTLEYGSRTLAEGNSIPSRPLFRPVFRKFGLVARQLGILT